MSLQCRERERERKKLKESGFTVQFEREQDGIGYDCFVVLKTQRHVEKERST